MFAVAFTTRSASSGLIAPDSTCSASFARAVSQTSSPASRHPRGRMRQPKPHLAQELERSRLLRDLVERHRDGRSHGLIHADDRARWRLLSAGQ
jgi:hypothetical protein